MTDYYFVTDIPNEYRIIKMLVNDMYRNVYFFCIFCTLLGELIMYALVGIKQKIEKATAAKVKMTICVYCLSWLGLVGISRVVESACYI